MKSLHNLYKEHQGKVSDKWSLYLDVYENIFKPYSSKPINMLEIGVQNGGSIEIWSNYFESARVLVGCDINTDCSKLKFDDERIHVIIKDANSDDGENLISKCSDTFDIIIDDGSHTSSDIIKSFFRYFKKLNNGGLFIIEDLHCSYWEHWEGGLYDPLSSISFFKRLVDVINFEHWGIDKSRTEFMDDISKRYGVTLSNDILSQVHSITFVNSMCIVKKDEAENNVLNKRIITGEQDLVVAGMKGWTGGMMVAPDQSKNYWSSLNKEPTALWLEECARFDKLKAELQYQNQELSLSQNKYDKLLEVLEEERNASISLQNKYNIQKLQFDKLINFTNSLQASTSWKITYPIRLAGTQLRRVFRIVTAAQRAAGQMGGYTRLFNRILYVYRLGGLTELRNRYGNILDANNFINTNAGVPEGRPALKIKQWQSLNSVDISKYDAISFDIFDTAIIRLFKEPADVFGYVERYACVPGFKESRVKAEQAARRRLIQQKDISLEDIYAEGLAVKPELEIEVENKICVPNPDAYELYRRALQLNKKVYFISDMYLPKATIALMLNKAGYVKYNELFVSSEDNLIKGDGSRFAAMEAIWDGEEVLHIGDNVVADYEQPKKFNIDAFNYVTNEDYFSTDPILGTQWRDLRAVDSLGISFLLGSYRYWQQGQHGAPESLWRNIGFLYGGPLIFQFCRYLNKRVSAIDSPVNLYFLARDGAIIKKVYELLHGGKKGSSNCHYMYASRRCMTFPLLSQDNDIAQKMMKWYAFCPPNTKWQDIFSRFGYEKFELLATALQQAEEKYGKLNESHVLACLNKCRSDLIKYSSNEYNDLTSYLKHIRFFDNEAMLVDVGWNGTIQDCLSSILSDNKGSSPLSGMYFGVTDNALNGSQKHGYLFDKHSEMLAEDFQPFYEFMELLTSSDEDSIQRVNKLGNDLYSPCYTVTCEEEELRKKISSEIQKGILEFSHIAKNLTSTNIPEFTPNDFLKLFQILQKNASEEIVKVFSETSHAVMPGGSYNTPVINFG